MLKRNMKEVTEKSKAYHFRSVRKISKRDNQLRHVCLSVCPSAWNNSVPTGRIFVKLDMNIFRKSIKKIKVSPKTGKN